MTTVKTVKTPAKAGDKTVQLDAAISAARKRKAERAGSPAPKGRGSSAEKPVAKVRLSPEERAAREAKREAERTASKAERDRTRAEKKANREQSKAKPHLAKVLKAAARLPKLGDRAQVLFNEITVNLPAAEAASLALHLNHFNRANATQRAIGQKLDAGMSVRIVGGDPRFIGMTGTVAKAQRIRCYIDVVGAKKPVYLFTSEVEVLAQAQSAATA